MGTSPRMRGKPLIDPLSLLLFRNIPAYAGKTEAKFALDTTWEEHPRVCGENEVAVEGELVVLGTSPRMRGKPR